jgi:hypothetical protein
MILAAVSSGRSSLAISAPTKADVPASSTAAVSARRALPPLAGAASKAVVRTVRTLMRSLLRTVAMALPA